MCISSISTTSTPAAERMASIDSPCALIQLYTATWLHFKNRPMERKPSPSRYSCRASRLVAALIRRCWTVCLYPHDLHLCRCFPLTMPSLLQSVELHLGQFINRRSALKSTYLTSRYTYLTIPENPYWQYLCGERFFQHRLPCHPTSLIRWRNRIGEAIANGCFR